MYSREIEGLARYLIDSNVHSSELCKFLVLETFSKFKASAICMMVITDEGHVQPESSFGIPKEVVTSMGTIPLHAETPIIAGFRSNEVAVVTRKQSTKVFPMLHEGAGMPSNVESIVLCPVLPHGGFALGLNCVPSHDQEFEMFLRAVGTLAALHFNRLQPQDESQFSKKPVRASAVSTTLTERQNYIKKMMENGFTNIQIANEIGYSQSLIRQETMAIYAALKISGRKELLEMSGKVELLENLPA